MRTQSPEAAAISSSSSSASSASASSASAIEVVSSQGPSPQDAQLRNDIKTLTGNDQKSNGQKKTKPMAEMKYKFKVLKESKHGKGRLEVLRLSGSKEQVLRIWLPPEYEPSKRYPTLYL